MQQMKEQYKDSQDQTKQEEIDRLPNKRIQSNHSKDGSKYWK